MSGTGTTTPGQRFAARAVVYVVLLAALLALLQDVDVWLRVPVVLAAGAAVGWVVERQLGSRSEGP